MRLSLSFAVRALLVTVFIGTHAAAADRTIEFNRDVRPILSQNCFACHGFDEKNRKGDLRLDVADEACKAREGVTPIKPGSTRESEVWARIVSTDPSEVMPPPNSHKELTTAQRETLRLWIEQGAKYQQHWAFEPIRRPEVPASTKPAWSDQPLDRFLLARMEQAGLAPRPEADRETLVRRVAFTLTGLPPAVAEVDTFLADKEPGAYERMVDRYLSSPHFGEEMARHWLDVARYADTHGLHLDNEREMWGYRDWVVRAFDENLPFDKFTIWQLAGDLLPSPRPISFWPRLQSLQRHHQRRGFDRRRVPVPLCRRTDQHDDAGLAGTDGRVRRLSQPQVRPDFDEGVLFAVRLLQ